MRILTLLFLALFVFSACSDEDSPTNPQINSGSMDLTMELKVGDTRIYDATFYNMDGEVEKKRFDTVKLISVRDSVFEGKKVKLFTYRKDEKHEFGLFETDSAIYNFSIEKYVSTLTFRADLYMNKSVRKNEKILFSISQSQEESYYLVKELDTKMSYNNKTYDCCKVNLVQESKPNSKIDTYYSQKYGMVSLIEHVKHPENGRMVKVREIYIVSSDIK